MDNLQAKAYNDMPLEEAAGGSGGDVHLEKGEVDIDKEKALHRGLSSRHLTMIGKSIIPTACDDS
jgi:amino acid permease